MVPLKTYAAGPHRLELITEINGVQFINDSKATNVDGMLKAIRATRKKATAEPNVWLIAGGKDKGLDFREAGPLLSQRVKSAILVGEAAARMHAAWNLFTPCRVLNSLLEAVAEAAKKATSGDVVLLSPACSSWDQFRNHQHRGEVFCQAVKSIGRGVRGSTPNINGEAVTTSQLSELRK
jgi:UDP-N-acetylmuramoylalanine--D-glutamate ligase